MCWFRTYLFNRDGTATYLIMASPLIASAMGDPLTIGEQISLLLFVAIVSGDAAGVTSAGMVTLAGGPRRTDPTWSTASDSSSAPDGSCSRPGRRPTSP